MTPHQIMPNDTRTWLDLYRENAALRADLSAQVAESQRLLRDRDAFWTRVNLLDTELEELRAALSEARTAIDRWCDDEDTTGAIDFILKLREVLAVLPGDREERQ